MVHKGVKHNCNYCDNKTTWPDNLTAHKMFIPKGVIFDCNCCDYKATEQHSITYHINLVHEEVYIILGYCMEMFGTFWYYMVPQCLQGYSMVLYGIY